MEVLYPLAPHRSACRTVNARRLSAATDIADEIRFERFIVTSAHAMEGSFAFRQSRQS